MKWFLFVVLLSFRKPTMSLALKSTVSGLIFYQWRMALHCARCALESSGSAKLSVSCSIMFLSCAQNKNECFVAQGPAIVLLKGIFCACW